MAYEGSGVIPEYTPLGSLQRVETDSGQGLGVYVLDKRQLDTASQPTGPTFLMAMGLHAYLDSHTLQVLDAMMGGMLQGMPNGCQIIAVETPGFGVDVSRLTTRQRLQLLLGGNFDNVALTMLNAARKVTNIDEGGQIIPTGYSTGSSIAAALAKIIPTHIPRARLSGVALNDPASWWQMPEGGRRSLRQRHRQDKARFNDHHKGETATDWVPPLDHRPEDQELLAKLDKESRVDRFCLALALCWGRLYRDLKTAIKQSSDLANGRILVTSGEESALAPAPWLCRELGRLASFMAQYGNGAVALALRQGESHMWFHFPGLVQSAGHDTARFIESGQIAAPPNGGSSSEDVNFTTFAPPKRRP